MIIMLVNANINNIAFNRKYYLLDGRLFGGRHKFISLIATKGG